MARGLSLSKAQKPMLPSGRRLRRPNACAEGYAFEPLMACAYSRPLYQPQFGHAVCGRWFSRQRGHVASVGALAFHWARRDRVRDRDFFHFGVRPPLMATFSSSCRRPWQPQQSSKAGRHG